LLNRKRELDRKGVSDTSDSTRVDSLGGESGRPSLPLKTDDLDKLEEVDETAVENVQQEAVKSEAVTEEKAGEQKEEEEMHTEEEKEENPPLTLYIKRHSNLFGDVLCAKISFQNDMFAVWPTTLSS
jgi:TATA-binding protein-associated factor Taf7